MAVNMNIYSNANAKQMSVSVDFVAELRSSSYDGISTEMEYFFKFETGSRDTDGLRYQPRMVGSLSHLALNRQKRASTDTNVAYPDIGTMIVDYMYDYIYGHAANKYSSGVTYKAPMRFS